MSSASSAPDFRTFLSTAVLSDQQNISYRSLSRALKCHVNRAKGLLYEYYEEQNKRKPGSVYATYLIAGTPTAAPAPEANGHGRANGRKKEGDDGAADGADGASDDDLALPSSLPPFSSSMLESSQQSQETVTGAKPPAVPVPLKTVRLVREEDLESSKAQFQDITSVHIYSLSPGRIADLVALTDIGRGLFANVFSKEDPLLHNKTYGVIQNKNVRRRKRRSDIPPPALVDKPAATPQPVTKATTSATATATPTSAAQAMASKATSSLKRENSASRPSSRDGTSTSASAKEDKKPTSTKRDARDIFKAFAKASSKAQPKAKGVEPQDTPMLDADEEGESDDEALFLDTNTRKSGSKRESDVRKEREDKAAKLRKMMDSDDDEDEAGEGKEPNHAETNTNKKEETAPAEGESNPDKPEEDDGAVAWSDSDAEDKPEKKAEPAAAAAAAAAAGPRRKRGKRKVIRKRTLKDDEGFLVTKEEEVWEDFSETDNDEPKKSPASSLVPQAKKSFPATATNNNSQANKEKSGGKAAAAPAAAAKKKVKGDIRGFFGKK